MDDKKHKRTTIKIDGEKLRRLLESLTSKSIYEIALENGYSRNIINEACRKGYASAAVQNLVKIYGIAPEAYQIKEPEKKGQMSFDDIAPDPLCVDPMILKQMLKEALFDVFYNSEIVIKDDKVKGKRLFLQERGEA